MRQLTTQQVMLRLVRRLLQLKKMTLQILQLEQQKFLTNLYKQ